MEGGDIRLHMEGELLEEVVTEALRHVSRDARDQVIQVASQEDFLMARMDSRLILQVIINLVNIAVKYTPKGSHIWFSWKRQGDNRYTYRSPTTAQASCLSTGIKFLKCFTQPTVPQGTAAVEWALVLPSAAPLFRLTGETFP